LFLSIRLSKYVGVCLFHFPYFLTNLVEVRSKGSPRNAVEPLCVAWKRKTQLT
jgi:hypothetical protein